MLSLLALIAVYENSRKDRFETNIFQLLNLHNNLIKTLSYSVTNNWIREEGGEEITETLIYRGRDVFGQLTHELMCGPDSIRFRSRDLLSEIKKGYEIFFSILNRKNALGNYFRNLYHIIRYIDESNFSVEYKKRFTRIVRAQLSNDELILLLCNGLSTYGESFTKLIYKGYL